MPPDDQNLNTGASGPTGPSGPSGPTAGANPPTPTDPVPRHKPHIENVVVYLASAPAGVASDPPNVVSLAAVAVPGEAWMAVEGEHFVDGSIVRLNGRAIPTTFESAELLTAQLTPTGLPKPGEYRVTVHAPAPTNGHSHPKKLFAEPAPQWDPPEKVLVGGSLIAAALWSFWIITSERQRTEPDNWLVSWFLMMIILALFAFGVGRALTGTWKSLLIDERHMRSLSRLQLVLWTGLVLSAIATASAWNVHNDADDPLGLHVPSELWILLGISTTALVGSNLIKVQPASLAMTEEEAAEALAKIENTDEQTATARRVDNISSVQARWTDMFCGEGVDNYKTLDVGKIQMFFFTVMLVLAYAAAFARSGNVPGSV